MDRGFKARMGTGLREWERTTEALLESVRFPDHARIDRDREPFVRCSETFLADSTGAMTSPKAILNTASALSGRKRHHILRRTRKKSWRSSP